MPTKNVFTVPQAAEELNIPRRTLMKYSREGLLPVRRLSPGRVVLYREDVERLRVVLEQYGRPGIRDGKAARPTVPA